VCVCVCVWEREREREFVIAENVLNIINGILKIMNILQNVGIENVGMENECFWEQGSTVYLAKDE
jgi:hypothetical protein